MGKRPRAGLGQGTHEVSPEHRPPRELRCAVRPPGPSRDLESTRGRACWVHLNKSRVTRTGRASRGASVPGCTRVLATRAFGPRRPRPRALLSASCLTTRSECFLPFPGGVTRGTVAVERRAWSDPGPWLIEAPRGRGPGRDRRPGLWLWEVRLSEAPLPPGTGLRASCLGPSSSVHREPSHQSCLLLG